MKRLLLILPIAIALLASSCKKCKEECQNGGICSNDACECTQTYMGKNCEISKMMALVKTATVNGTTFEYKYDSKGRRIMVSWSNGTSSYTYSYTDSTALIIRFNNGLPTDTIKYILNSLGYAVSNNEGWTCSYDDEGHKVSDNSGSAWGYINGNLIGYSFYYSWPEHPSPEPAGYSYTYYKDTLDTRDMGMKTFNGVESKNLVKSGSKYGDYTFIYEYDSKGRIVKGRNGYDGGNYTYTYFD